jgi:predicted nucleotidyltransferase
VSVLAPGLRTGREDQGSKTSRARGTSEARRGEDRPGGRRTARDCGERRAGRAVRVRPRAGSGRAARDAGGGLGNFYPVSGVTTPRWRRRSPRSRPREWARLGARLDAECARYSGYVSDQATDATRRLFAAAESGELARMCVRTRLALMVLFGSAAHGTGDPEDVDLAVSFERGAPRDVLTVLDELYQLAGYEGFDILDLDRAGPLARERALVGGRLLHQARDGVFATTLSPRSWSGWTPTRCAGFSWS